MLVISFAVPHDTAVDNQSGLGRRFYRLSGDPMVVRKIVYEAREICMDRSKNSAGAAIPPALRPWLNDEERISIAAVADYCEDADFIYSGVPVSCLKLDHVSVNELTTAEILHDRSGKSVL